MIAIAPFLILLVYIIQSTMKAMKDTPKVIELANKQMIIQVGSLRSIFSKGMLRLSNLLLSVLASPLKAGNIQ